MSLQSLLVSARRAKARRMTSTCSIERPGAESTNMTTGVVSQTLTPVYEGACYIPRDAVESHDERSEGYYETRSVVCQACAEQDRRRQRAQDEGSSRDKPGEKHWITDVRRQPEEPVEVT